MKGIVSFGRGGLRQKPSTVFCFRRSAAFTLVELLVTLTIVAVLLGMILPALSSAREMGRRATCLNNMRQLSLGMTMFADENNGQFPPYVYELTAVPGSSYPAFTVNFKSGWAMTDTGPIVNPAILLCPSDKNPAIINTTDAQGKTIQIKSSYGYNFEMLAAGVGIQHLDLERTALLFDGNPDAVLGDPWAGNSGNTAPPSASAAPTATLNNGNGKKLQCTPDAANKTWICHAPPGNPAQTHCAYVGITASGPQGHSNHAGDYCGPCNGWACDIARFNSQLVDRRHFSRANILFADGHGEFLPELPADSLTAWR